jgi:amino acid transporter
MSHEIPAAGPRELRQFGITTGTIVVVLFAGLFPWLLERPIPTWPLVIGGVLIVWGLLLPASLGPVYRGWMKFGTVMSRITTPILMTAIFVLVIVPVALVLRLLKKDPMCRKFDRDASSYRVTGSGAETGTLDKPY